MQPPVWSPIWKPTNAPLGNKQKAVAANTMSYLDSVLVHNDYLAGDDLSIANITAFASRAFVDFTKVEIPPEPVSPQCAYVRGQAWPCRTRARLCFD